MNGLKDFFNSPTSYQRDMDLYFYAVFHENTAAVAKFLDKYPDKADQKDMWGWTALMHAAQLGHVDAVKLLLEKGADPDVQNRDGLTAAMLAQKHHKVKAAVLLEQWSKKKRLAMPKAFSLD